MIVRKQGSIEDYAAEWPFGAFWAALNAQLHKDGYPEVRFKGARDAWETALRIAQQSCREYSKAAMAGATQSPEASSECDACARLAFCECEQEDDLEHIRKNPA